MLGAQREGLRQTLRQETSEHESIQVTHALSHAAATPIHARHPSQHDVSVPARRSGSLDSWASARERAG